jgi:hypothetical protein
MKMPTRQLELPFTGPRPLTPVRPLPAASPGMPRHSPVLPLKNGAWRVRSNELPPRSIRLDAATEANP